MVAIQRLCIAVLVMLVCVQASWITAVRMMFRPRRSAAPTTRVISEIEELKQQLAIMHEQTAALKRMVRSSKQHVQVFRKEMETLQRAHRLELQAMGDQYIANEDELRNDLLSGSEEELRTVVKELENKNELEKQQLVANMTNAHNRELASLRVTLRQCEKTLYENEHIIKDLKAELLESSRRHSLQREHEVSLHEQVCSPQSSVASPYPSLYMTVSFIISLRNSAHFVRSYLKSALHSPRKYWRRRSALVAITETPLKHQHRQQTTQPRLEKRAPSAACHAAAGACPGNIVQTQGATGTAAATV